MTNPNGSTPCSRPVRSPSDVCCAHQRRPESAAKICSRVAIFLALTTRLSPDEASPRCEKPLARRVAPPRTADLWPPSPTAPPSAGPFSRTSILAARGARPRQLESDHRPHPRDPANDRLRLAVTLGAGWRNLPALLECGILWLARFTLGPGLWGDTIHESVASQRLKPSARGIARVRSAPKLPERACWRHRPLSTKRANPASPSRADARPRPISFIRRAPAPDRLAASHWARRRESRESINASDAQHRPSLTS